MNKKDLIKGRDLFESIIKEENREENPTVPENEIDTSLLSKAKKYFNMETIRKLIKGDWFYVPKHYLNGEECDGHNKKAQHHRVIFWDKKTSKVFSVKDGTSPSFIKDIVTVAKALSV